MVRGEWEIGAGCWKYAMLKRSQKSIRRAIRFSWIFSGGGRRVGEVPEPRAGIPAVPAGRPKQADYSQRGDAGFVGTPR